MAQAALSPSFRLQQVAVKQWEWLLLELICSLDGLHLTYISCIMCTADTGILSWFGEGKWLMTWGFAECMFTGCCTAGTFISFHDLFYLVLKEKKQQWSENREQSARKYECLVVEEVVRRLVCWPSARRSACGNAFSSCNITSLSLMLYWSSLLSGVSCFCSVP